MPHQSIPRRGTHQRPVAQGTEQWFPKPRAGSSSLPRPASPPYNDAMTKAVICSACGDIFSPVLDWRTDRRWRWCQCGDCGGRWANGVEGTLEVTASGGPDGVRVLGMANNFITTGRGLARLGHDEWRVAHGELARTVGQGYLFHERNRNCWAVIVAPHESADITFVDVNEARAAHYEAAGLVAARRAGPAPSRPGDSQTLPAGSS